MAEFLFGSVDAALEFYAVWRPRMSAPTSLGFADREDYERRLTDGGRPQAEDIRNAVIDIEVCLDGLLDIERTVLWAALGLAGVFGHHRVSTPGGGHAYMDDRGDLVVDDKTVVDLPDPDRPGRKRAAVVHCLKGGKGGPQPKGPRLLSFYEVARGLGWTTPAGRTDYRRVQVWYGKARRRVRLAMMRRHLLRH